jgi:hypothetical protein
MTEPLEVILEPEVLNWLSHLDSASFGRLAARIDRLAEDRLVKGVDDFVLSVEDVTASEPGELRCLLLYHGENDSEDFSPNITYFVCNGKAYLLTVYRAIPTKVEAEKDRARKAWIAVVSRGGCDG